MWVVGVLRGWVEVDESLLDDAGNDFEEVGIWMIE